MGDKIESDSDVDEVVDSLHEMQSAPPLPMSTFSPTKIPEMSKQLSMDEEGCYLGERVDDDDEEVDSDILDHQNKGKYLPPWLAWCWQQKQQARKGGPNSLHSFTSFTSTSCKQVTQSVFSINTGSTSTGQAAHHLQLKDPAVISICENAPSVEEN